MKGKRKRKTLRVKEYLKKFARPTPAVEAIRREAKSKGLDRITLREINREIKLCRLERSRKHVKSG
jgi:hypothetical protein